MRKVKKLIGLIVVLMFVATGAWIWAERVESPNQVAARAEPPTPDPVVASLDRGYLSGPVSMSTTANYERTVTIEPPLALTGVVTSLDKTKGDPLESGTVLLRANGRPVFVLTGAFPLYRDINPGDTGDDVTAIQSSLKAAGYSTGRDRDGHYGSGSQAAVRKMYKAAGFVAPEVSMPPEPAAAADPTVTAPVAPAVIPGPRILTTEVVMIAQLPATVEVIAPVGTVLSSDTSLVTLGTGPVLLSATLPSGSLGTLAAGAVGTFVNDTGAPGSAQVATMSPAEAAGEVVVTLSPTDAVTAGSSYVLTIDNPAVESGEALLAPISAVVSRGGKSYIYVRDEATYREVEVTVTGSVGGVAALEPVSLDVLLEEGTEVRVG